MPSDFPFFCEWEVFRLMSVNKGCCGHWAITLQSPLMVPPSPQPLQAHPTGYPKRLSVRKHRTLAPDGWGAHQRGDFNETRLLHLPVHRKYEAPSFEMSGFLCAVLSHFSCAQRFTSQWTVATGLLCPWGSPGKNAGVGCHALLQGIFLTQGLNPGLQHCRQIR